MAGLSELPDCCKKAAMSCGMMEGDEDCCETSGDFYKSDLLGVLPDMEQPVDASSEVLPLPIAFQFATVPAEAMTIAGFTYIPPPDIQGSDAPVLQVFRF